ncbi:CDP-diacylglycerol--inositol 3-phosphatidyltransferase [Indicator indicator]|uniref:CDP-diacylglycerol--inositol 3-phosphatidyltransferase n=1 Tax=Indicator indicator TaxID=1002788 RepID=UPI0023DF6D92|nr:CDP-diacylglycerol--inositol 3-phosphatidyltransferase [Indicator indicator]
MAGGGAGKVFLFLPNIIGYARILLAAVAFSLLPRQPGLAMSCYALSGLLDAVDGHVARLLDQGSRLGAMLDMLTDRLASACLLVNLALLYPMAAPLFQLSLVVDLASHWLHMHCATLQGGRSHKAITGEGPRVLQLYYSNRPLLFLLCAGNEVFYCCLSLLATSEGPGETGGTGTELGGKLRELGALGGHWEH